MSVSCHLCLLDACWCVKAAVCGGGMLKGTDYRRHMWCNMYVLVFTDNEAITLGKHSRLWHM